MAATDTPDRTRRLGHLGLAPYVLLLPSLVFLAVFFARPMVDAFTLAFEDPSGGFGLEPIRQMMADSRFGEALRTTLILLVAIVPVQFVLAMSMALVINAKLKGQSVWLYIYAIPLAVSELAAGIIWLSIFTQRGWLNSWLIQTGLLEQPFDFLGYQNRGWLIAAIVLAEAWRATSIIMIILVAGLQSIPSDYLEAAEIYGANLWKRIRYVILPMLRPSLQVALILRTVLALQVFAIVIALAGASMTVLSAEAYKWQVTYRGPNVAAAYAGLILLLSSSAAALFLWLLPASPRSGRGALNRAARPEPEREEVSR
ncbi:carbohydrate ABC transporter permease [Egicoccus sp. AB-alg2]|uniref:carbohydrate ABC transporter permease n=1 Tax=Egicoccus sp. AB-alg2 TaxID=3242693 RepID=UPI00359E98EA